jgi:hypothetical protein
VAKLTPFHIKNAKPGRHGDGKGLYLLVSPSGSKSWVLRVQVDGRRRDFGLGSTDVLSLQQAREKAADGRRMAKEGLDPSVEWKRVRTALPTFEEAARRYHEQVKGSWRKPIRTAHLPIFGGVVLKSVTGIVPRRITRMRANSVTLGSATLGS